MLKVTFRSASSEDRAYLADVFLTSMRDVITRARGCWNVDKEAAQFHAQLALDETWVLRDGDADVGFVMKRSVSATTSELHTLCLAPPAQGRGVGTAVMRELMSDADACGSVLELSVLKENPRARQFYERLGFVEVARSEHHVRMRREPAL